MSDIRHKLDALRVGAARHYTRATPPRHMAQDIAAALGGALHTGADGTCWRIETEFDQVCPAHTVSPEAFLTSVDHAFGGSADRLDPARLIVLDIETGGFSGTPVFLVGVVLPDQRPLRVCQFLARDYPEEEGVLRAVADLAATRTTWVTFNGKSFDEPFLRERSALYHLTLPPIALHVDLLHAARRRWRGTLPDCRLATLEAHVLERPRVGDVPGSDAPDLFHHFIRTGNANVLRAVLEHNQQDLVSCTELLLRLARATP